MDMDDVADFLVSMDEPEMAELVLNTHNRLELLIGGIDRTCYEAMKDSAEKLVEENDRLQKQISILAGIG